MAGENSPDRRGSFSPNRPSPDPGYRRFTVRVGGHILSHTIDGTWTQVDLDRLISLLELRAVDRSLHHVLPLVRGRRFPM